MGEVESLLDQSTILKEMCDAASNIQTVHRFRFRSGIFQWFPSFRGFRV
jgi:hypothetical protein